MSVPLIRQLILRTAESLFNLLQAFPSKTSSIQRLDIALTLG